MIRRSTICAAAGFAVLLTACETRPQTHAFDGRCWIRGADQTLSLLDAHVDNIETCGARLEVRHLQTKAPVSGVFGGVNVYANAHAIEADTLYGHRTRLVSAADRARIDLAIRSLLPDEPLAAKAPT